MLHCVLYKYMFMGNDRNVYVKKKPSKVTELIWKDLFILSWLLVGSYFLFFGKIYVLHYWSLLFIDFSSLELLLNIEPYHKINDIHLLRMLFDHFFFLHTGIVTIIGTPSLTRFAGCHLYTPGLISQCLPREFKVLIANYDYWSLLARFAGWWLNPVIVQYISILVSDYIYGWWLFFHDLLQISLVTRLWQRGRVVMKRWKQMHLMKVMGYVS